MAEEAEREGSGGAHNPWKALGIALLVDLALLPLVFVLFVYWPIYYLTIVPYIGGRLGGRFVDKRLAMRIGVAAAITGVTVLMVVFLSFLSLIPGDNLDLTEPIGLSLIIVSYLLAILFGALGGRHGASLYEDR